MDNRLDDLIAARRDLDGPLLPILHAVQEEFGHVSEDAVRRIAGALNLSRAEVHGVVSFYHDFTTAPDPRPVVKLCRAEACQARGSETLAASLPPQDRVRIETTYCLGLCSVGPNAMVGRTLHARLDSDRLAALVAQLT